MGVQPVDVLIPISDRPRFLADVLFTRLGVAGVCKPILHGDVDCPASSLIWLGLLYRTYFWLEMDLSSIPKSVW